MQHHATAYCAWNPKYRTLYTAGYRPLPALQSRVRTYAMYGVRQNRYSMHIQSCRP